jgi:hypothetical protein
MVCLLPNVPHRNWRPDAYHHDKAVYSIVEHLSALTRVAPSAMTRDVRSSTVGKGVLVKKDLEACAYFQRQTASVQKRHMKFRIGCPAQLSRALETYHVFFRFFNDYNTLCYVLRKRLALTIWYIKSASFTMQFGLSLSLSFNEMSSPPTNTIPGDQR